MTARIGIVGYGMGNIASLRNAFRAIGADVFVARSGAELGAASHVVLPGVGAFKKGMEQLRIGGFDEPIRRHVASGRPLLGVCLGMQLLGTEGEEHGFSEGLGLVPGRVTRLAADGLPLPHIGWNDSHVLRAGVAGSAGETAFFYYVHSFHLVPSDPADVVMTCSYGTTFVAGIQRASIHGFQFHPEKSQSAGLGVLTRFAALSS